MTPQYDSTAKGLMMWATSELEHVGRIISMKDKDLQYSYALSTVNGMAHLKDAIFQYVQKHPKSHMRDDLLTIHEKVIRAFNTRGTLSSFEYLKNGSKRRKTRKTHKNRKI